MLQFPNRCVESQNRYITNFFRYINKNLRYVGCALARITIVQLVYKRDVGWQ